MDIPQPASLFAVALETWLLCQQGEDIPEDRPLPGRFDLPEARHAPLEPLQGPLLEVVGPIFGIHAPEADHAEFHCYIVPAGQFGYLAGHDGGISQGQDPAIGRADVGIDAKIPEVGIRLDARLLFHIDAAVPGIPVPGEHDELGEGLGLVPYGLDEELVHGQIAEQISG